MPHWRKLTDEQVVAIRRRRAEGEGVRELARYYSCSPGNVCRIVHGDSRGPTMRQRIATLTARVAWAERVYGPIPAEVEQ